MSEAAMNSASSNQTTVKLRLTKRGRTVFGALTTLAIAALLALVAVLASPQAQAADSAQHADDFSYIVVQPGESLWSVATALDTKVDPRDLVGEIVQLNQLSESGVQAGQPIAVPLRYSENPITVSADELGI